MVADIAMTTVRQVFFVSDGTGISAQGLGEALLTQFDELEYEQITYSFIKTVDKARETRKKIEQLRNPQGLKPIIFTTLLDPDCLNIIKEIEAFHIDVFDQFLTPLEQELGMASAHSIGRSHNVGVHSRDYTDRIEAINFSLAYDDGARHRGLEQADVILVGVSRSGKTPTSLYLAIHYGVRAANYPLIPEDFDRGVLPGDLEKYREKLFGLTIRADRLHGIRTERRPDSSYAELINCRKEIQRAEAMMRQYDIPWIETTSKSIEELSASIVQAKGLRNRHF
ncbi:MAG: kinase/pyrophosphorylase [Gammaproteobacteria bacterium]|nr:kinase/pyrophosphorylase [Gammaproteobacteria bacterium]